jgi:hypothetical protein
LANKNLSPWYFAVRYSALVFQQRINDLEQRGLDCSYDRHSLKLLQEMEQFLEMSWDVYMDSLGSTKELAK